MLRNRKSISGRCLSFILTILSASGSGIATASDDVPVGYKADRYQPVWDRNPFTIVTPVVQSAQPKVFDKLVLVSWLNDGGNDVVFVQNIETNEVQKITKDPNSNNFRLVAIHKAADPKDADAVLSNGNEEGSVKFRLEAVAAAPPQGGQPQAGVRAASRSLARTRTGAPRMLHRLFEFHARFRSTRVCSWQSGAAKISW